MARLRLVAMVVCAALKDEPDAPTRASGAGTIIIVARLGKLGPTEVSPRASSRAPILWRTALEGVTLAQVERGSSLGPTASVEELRRALVPEGVDASLVDLSSAPAADNSPPAFRKLREIFGAPPPPSAREVEEVKNLRKAFGAREESAGRLEQPAAARSLTDLESIVREAAARSPPLILVRLVAEDDGDDAVALRDRGLKSIFDAAAADAHVLVLSLPNDGPGTLIAQGPRMKKARVIPRSIALASVRATISTLLGEPAPGEAASPVEEPIREALR